MKSANRNFEKRLRRLEQQNVSLKKTNRVLFCLTGLLAVVVFFGRENLSLISQSRADLPMTKEISATRFVLRDSQGNIRGIWQTNDAEGSVSFYTGSKDKRNAVILQADARGAQANILSDKEASLTIDGKKALLSEKGEELAFILKDTLQNTARLYVSPEFSGLEFYDKGDLRSVTLGNRNGKASLELFSTAYNSRTFVTPEKQDLFSDTKQENIPFAEKEAFLVSEEEGKIQESEQKPADEPVENEEQ